MGRMNDPTPILIPYAYNILGSYQDAEDVVQDVLMEQLMEERGVHNKRGYLIKSVVNRSINLKNRQKRMIHSGTWLPEPVATERADTRTHLESILSYSLSVLLEKLRPKERAVFILKKSFDYTHKEIADVLDITIENARKILSRATDKLSVKSSGSEPVNQAFLRKYVAIIREGNVKKLEDLLHDDIAIEADGGEEVAVMQNIIRGKERGSKLLLGLFNKFQKEMDIRLSNINFQPALLYSLDKKLVLCQVLEIEQGQIRNIYSVFDPKKLNGLKDTGA